MKGVDNDGSYLVDSPDWDVADSGWKANQILRILQRNAVTAASVCEVGCGAGEVLKQLADRIGSRAKFTGYEVSEQAFKLCASRERDNLRYFCKDLLRDEESAFFDLILAIDVFEHFSDYLGFLERLRAKGRYKVFHIPLDLSVQALLRARPLMQKRRLLGHLHYFSQATALATLEDAGYKILDQIYTPSAFLTKKSGLWGCVLQLVRRSLFCLHKDLTVRILGGYSLMVLAE